MSQNYLSNPYQSSYSAQPNNPNAVSINIFSPAAYGNGTSSIPTTNSNQNSNGFYSLYGTNPGNMMYPQNYNNMIQQPINNGYSNTYIPNNGGIIYPYNMNTNSSSGDVNSYNENGKIPQIQKTPQEASDNIVKSEDKKTNKKNQKEKSIVPLTDDYVKSLENYLNDSNAKVRLIAAKEIMQRFKEDDSRKDNKSLIPLLNKTLQDKSSSVRFLGLTTLQLGYSCGDDRTVQILKDLASNKTDNLGEDQLLASEILLKISGQPIKVSEG